MAKVFRLANDNAGTTVDLLGGTLQLKAGSFAPRTPPVINEYQHTRFGVQQTFQHYDVQTEQFDLVAKSASMASILTAVGNIEAMLEKVRLWHEDPVRYDGIWLEANANGESPKRSLILEGAIAYPHEEAGINVFKDFGFKARMYLSRHPLWESQSTQDNTYTGVSCWGGKTSALASGGTAPARVSNLRLMGASGGGGPLTRFWAGVRPTYDGTSGYVPVWELEAGTAGTDTALGSESGASPSGSTTNNKLRCTFSNTALVKRASINASNVSGISPDYAHMAGRYLVLLRCKLSAAGTVGVQLRSGMAQSGGPSLPSNSEVYITNTGWQLIDLGEVQIPPMGNRSAINVANAIKYFTLEVWAEQLSGTPSLDLDALCLIPSEHFVYVDGAAVQYSGGETNPVYFVTNEDDTLVCLNFIASVPNQALEFVMRDFYVPVEGGVLVVAGQESASHVLTDSIDIECISFRRWLSLRSA